MANTFQVDVVSAEEQIFSGLAEFVALPGERVSWVSTRSTPR
jgi:F-type H+-transporting ATPase subunit epsilon